MKPTFFAMYSLILFVLFGFLYLFGVTLFNDSDDWKHEARKQEMQAQQSQLHALIARQEMMSFRQHVALELPQAGADKKYPVRNIASLITEPNTEAIHLERASTMFENGRALFRQKKFYDSSVLFRRIVEQHSDSVHVIEAYFLLIEGLYQSRQFEPCAEYVSRMMTLYPDNELTGFSLLRLGSIYQERDRLEDAADVFRLISKNYSNETLKRQAKAVLSEIEL